MNYDGFVSVDNWDSNEPPTTMVCPVGSEGSVAALAIASPMSVAVGRSPTVVRR